MRHERLELDVAAGLLALALGSSGCGMVLGIDDLVADLGSQSSGSGPTGGGCTSTCGTQGCGDCPGTSQVTSDDGSYRIDAYEVTNADYKAWLLTNPSTSKPDQGFVCAWNDSFVPGVPSKEAIDAVAGLGLDKPFCTDAGMLDQAIAEDKGKRPVSCVDWCDAVAYCKWAGKHLCGKIGGGTVDINDGATGPHDDPAVSEWFRACSKAGTRAYPYADIYDDTKCNDDNSKVEDVGHYPGCVGGFDGLYDMSGNATEWEDACSKFDNPPVVENCLLRGGAYYQTDPAEQACGYFRDVLRAGSSPAHGFRCCAGPG